MQDNDHAALISNLRSFAETWRSQPSYRVPEYLNKAADALSALVEENERLKADKANLIAKINNAV